MGTERWITHARFYMWELKVDLREAENRVVVIRFWGGMRETGMEKNG